MKTILLVEDDRSLGEILSERLRKEGYGLTWIREAREFSNHSPEQFDLVILDINLPDGSGLDLAKEIRKKSETPFLFMTALADPQTRLQGFELGAEEFIPKPFHLKELLLRVSHVIQSHQPLRRLEINQITIDFQSMNVTSVLGDKLNAPIKDIELLKHLIKRSPEVVSRDELLTVLWGEQKESSHRTIDNMIVRLRELLGSDNLIRAVRGIGYQWAGKNE